MQQQAEVMNYSLCNEQRSINERRRSACADVCEAVIWRIWQDSSEHGQNESRDRGLAKCGYVSWNHRAAGKWINKYPLQPCCLFPCSGRAGKARSPVAAWTLLRQTAADLLLSSLYGTLRPSPTWPAALHNSKLAQLLRLRKWDQTNKVGNFNRDAL